jgi:hypothetical protein
MAMRGRPSYDAKDLPVLAEIARRWVSHGCGDEPPIRELTLNCMPYGPDEKPTADNIKGEAEATEEAAEATKDETAAGATKGEAEATEEVAEATKDETAARTASEILYPKKPVRKDISHFTERDRRTFSRLQNKFSKFRDEGKVRPVGAYLVMDGGRRRALRKALSEENSKYMRWCGSAWIDPKKP